MKNYKRGFTLAEVSTALAIVGVVAAVVIPLVIKNIQQQQSGAILGRAVEQIELGCQNMIQLANANRTDGSYSDVLSTISMKDIGAGNVATSIVPVYIRTYAPAYWGLHNQTIAEAQVKTIKSYNGGAGGTDSTRALAGTKYAFSKFPAAVSICSTGAAPANANLDAETGNIIYIDTNGWDKYPNRTGKDIFAFKLLNNGTLVPATGTEAGNYAERVVKDGFKIKY